MLLERGGGTQIPCLTYKQCPEKNSMSYVGEADQSPGQQAQIVGTGLRDGWWVPVLLPCTPARSPSAILGHCGPPNQLKASRNQEEISLKPKAKCEGEEKRDTVVETTGLPEKDVGKKQGRSNIRGARWMGKRPTHAPVGFCRRKGKHGDRVDMQTVGRDHSVAGTGLSFIQKRPNNCQGHLGQNG